MKTIKYIICLFVLLFSLQASATKYTKDMLSQVNNISSAWKPIIGDSLYTIKKQKLTIIVMRMYDSSKQDSDPEKTDVQVVFIKKDNVCSLVAITFSPVDVTSYIDLLVE